MKLLIGLGNPGSQYENTRHNIGFMVLEKLALELAPQALIFEQSAAHKVMVAKVADIILMKPLTYMNLSGEAVSYIQKFYKIPLTDMIVIHDDIDLPLGKIRIRDHGASGGHNGVASIITLCGGDTFVRVRLGIGRGNETSDKEPHDHDSHIGASHHVLSQFTEHEAGDVRKLVKHGVEAVRTILEKGIDTAMNQFN